MGGGDLNFKKAWHPLTQENQERVWLEEKKAKEEEKKLEQLKKEIAEEKARQEFLEMQERAGLIKRSRRLEWMYSGAVASTEQITDEKEQYLLGTKRPEDIKEKKMDIQVDCMTVLGNAGANSQRDILCKIREDPLMVIRKKEQESLSLQKKERSRSPSISHSVKSNRNKHQDSRNRDKYRDRSRDRDRDRSNRDRSRDRSRHRDRSRNRSNHYNRDRSRDRSRNRSSHYR